MNSPEIHLFLIWSKALHAADSILADLDATFERTDAADVAWSPELFSQNIARFYTTQLPPGSHKERECGTGPFRAIVVRDSMPVYEQRLTSKGWASVNARVFDARARYRDWTGGGHKIHASITEAEAYRDLRLLFNIDATEYKHSRPNHQKQIRRVECDLVGARGWDSIQQLMNALNAVMPCVVPFGIDSLDSSPVVGSPITMLVGDRWDAVMIANGRPRKTRLHGRLTYDVDVADRRLWFDLRQVGEGYFDPAWERAMLSGRVVVNGWPLAAPEDRQHALLYEDLVRPSQQAKVDSASARQFLDLYFARFGYRYANLHGPGVPVMGERMPVKWKVGAIRRWIIRAGKSAQRRINARFGRATQPQSRHVIPLMQDRSGESIMQLEIPSAVRSVFQAFEDRGLAWVLLRPAAPIFREQGDIDLLMRSTDLSGAIALLRDGGFLQVPLPYYGTHRHFVRYDTKEDRWIWLDIVTELRFGQYGCIRIPVEEHCLNRRHAEDSLAQLPAPDLFWILMFRCLLDKGAVADRDAVRLQEFAAYASPDDEIAVRVQSMFSWCHPSDLLRIIRHADWSAIDRLSCSISRNMHRVWSRYTWRLLPYRLDVLRKLSCTFKRRGIGVALCDKDVDITSLIAGVQKSAEPPLRALCRRHGVLTVVIDQSARNSFNALLLDCARTRYHKMFGRLVIWHVPFGSSIDRRSWLRLAGIDCNFYVIPGRCGNSKIDNAWFDSSTGESARRRIIVDSIWRVYASRWRWQTTEWSLNNASGC